VPAGLTNIVAIAAGGGHCLALSNNGTVAAWGANNAGQCSVPAGLSNVMAIAAGWEHSVALKNDGGIVEWGDNSSGQTNVPQPYPGDPYAPIKLLAAGGDHTLAAIWSPLVQYPVDVTKDLLLIYNTNSTDSSNVCQYYLTHRPMVGNANVLPIGCTTNEIIEPNDYTNNLVGAVKKWLAANPTKRPQYVIVFQDVPSRLGVLINIAGNIYSTPSIQYELNTACATNWSPIVTSINMNGMGGTNDCIAYINKLASMGSNNPPGQLFLSAGAAIYGNSNWYFDDAQGAYPTSPFGLEATEGVTSNGVLSVAVTYTPFTTSTHITAATNVAGYLSWGYNGDFGGYVTNVSFFGASTWYLIQTIESFNGQRNGGGFQGDFLEWFAGNAFNGTNYSNTPVGGVSHVDEPSVRGVNNSDVYFGLWASRHSFGFCAWNSRNTPCFQAVGDPFVKK